VAEANQESDEAIVIVEVIEETGEETNPNNTILMGEPIPISMTPIPHVVVSGSTSNIKITVDLGLSATFPILINTDRPDLIYAPGGNIQNPGWPHSLEVGDPRHPATIRVETLRQSAGNVVRIWATAHNHDPKDISQAFSMTTLKLLP